MPVCTCVCVCTHAHSFVCFAVHYYLLRSGLEFFWLRIHWASWNRRLVTFISSRGFAAVTSSNVVSPSFISLWCLFWELQLDVCEILFYPLCLNFHFIFSLLVFCNVFWIISYLSSSSLILSLVIANLLFSSSTELFLVSILTHKF